MKKLGIALILSTLIISGCNTTSKKKKHSSSEQTSLNSSEFLSNSDSVPTSNTSNTSASTSDPDDELLNDVESLIIDGYRTIFEVGDEFEYGGTVIAVFGDGTQRDVTNEATKSGFNSDNPVENQIITVRYDAPNGSYAATTYFVNIIKKSIDLGKLKIDEVIKYIDEHPIDIPTGMKGAVDYDTKVTVDGFALQKIDLWKETKNFGLNFSSRYKVILGDDTGYIGAASSAFYNKVGEYDGNSDSKYTITGYLSVYMGNPEIFVIEYKFDKTLTVSFDAKARSKGEMSFSSFFETSKNMEYNCAGYAYGGMYTFSNVTSYLWKSNSSYEKFAWITDGSSIIKTIAHNRPNLTQDSVFNIVAILSLKDYSPALWIIDVEKVTSVSPISLDTSLAEELSINNLKTKKTSQDDTNDRFPDYIMGWSKLYKTTGYLTTIEQGGKYYIGIRDEYYESTTYINGKDNARANYGIALIHNDDFWNIVYDKIAGTAYGESVDANEPVEVFYIMHDLTYYSGKTCWNILLLPSTFPMVYE